MKSSLATLNVLDDRWLKKKVPEILAEGSFIPVQILLMFQSDWW